MTSPRRPNKKWRGQYFSSFLLLFLLSLILSVTIATTLTTTTTTTTPTQIEKTIDSAHSESNNHLNTNMYQNMSQNGLLDPSNPGSSFHPNGPKNGLFDSPNHNSDPNEPFDYNNHPNKLPNDPNTHKDVSLDPSDTNFSHHLTTSFQQLAENVYTNAASTFIPYITDVVAAPPSYGDCVSDSWSMGGGCSFGILCVSASGAVVPCLPRCTSCQVPPTPTQFLCGAIRGNCASTTGCFYLQRDGDWCQNKEIVIANVQQLYSTHQCHCGEQCALTSTPPDPTALFTCTNASKPAQVRKCAVEVHQRYGHCLQEDDLHVLQVSRDSHIFTTYRRSTYSHYQWGPVAGTPSPDLTINLPVAVIDKNFCSPTPVPHPLTYYPQEGCAFEWGCLDLRVSDGLFDPLCTPVSCNTCGESLGPRVRCRAKFNGIYQFDLTSSQTDLHYQYNVGCASASNNQPIQSQLTQCQCKYGCGSMTVEQANQVGDDTTRVPLNTLIPEAIKSTLLSITKTTPLQCFYRPTDEEIFRLRCDSKVEAARTVYCIVDGYRLDDDICAMGYLGTTTPPDYPQDPTNNFPPRYFHFIELATQVCEAEVLCRLGKDGGVVTIDPNYQTTLNLPSLLSPLKITEPQSDPIKEMGVSDQYPPYWTKCGAMCNNMCMGTIPIVITQSCFARSCSYPYPLGSENQDQEVCYYVQLPYNDPRCDDETKGDFYQPRRGLLPTTLASTPYAMLQNRIKCECDPYCTPAPFNTDPAPLGRPVGYRSSYVEPTILQTLPTVLEPQLIANIPLYPCDYISGTKYITDPDLLAGIDAATLTPETYGYRGVPTPNELDGSFGTTPAPWDTVKHCFKPVTRRPLLVSKYNPYSPQVIAVESCSVSYDASMYSEAVPLSLDPSNGDYQSTFRCVSSLFDTIIAPIKIIMDKSTTPCQPQYNCRKINSASGDPWGKCQNEAGENLHFPDCSTLACGVSIFREVQCAYAQVSTVDSDGGSDDDEQMRVVDGLSSLWSLSNNNNSSLSNNNSLLSNNSYSPSLPTHNLRIPTIPMQSLSLSLPTPMQSLALSDSGATPKEISAFYLNLYRPLLAPLYGPAFMIQLDSFFTMRLVTVLTRSCAALPPDRDICQCEPQYFCAPQDTRLKPSSTWKRILQPCFVPSPDTGEMVEQQYGFAARCPACKGVDNDGETLKGVNRRDIFCLQRDGTFISITNLNDSNQCTRARIPKPQMSQACVGEIKCYYTWRCPATTTGLSQSNWGDAALAQASCSSPITFSTSCYVPIPGPITEPTGSDIVIWNNIRLGPDQCTQIGLRIRTKLCIAYTIDSANRHVQLPASVAYDPTCHTVPSTDSSLGQLRDEVVSGSGIVYNVPKDSVGCVDFTSCRCPSSIFTGPQCDISPTVTEFVIRSTLVQPPSVVVGSPYIVAKEGSLLTALWTYSGNPNNQIFFYLHDIYSAITGDPIIPVFLGKTSASLQRTALYVPEVPGLQTQPSNPAHIRAYVGVDNASSLTQIGGVQAALGIHITAAVIKCNDVICNMNNVKIWNTYLNYPTYAWSNSVEACSYIVPTSQSINKDGLWDGVIEEGSRGGADGSHNVIGTIKQQQNAVGAIELQATVGAYGSILPEPTPISTIPNAIITGCNCVTPPVGATFTMDPTCTIATQCQRVSFSETGGRFGEPHSTFPTTFPIELQNKVESYSTVTRGPIETQQTFPRGSIETQNKVLTKASSGSTTDAKFDDLDYHSSTISLLPALSSSQQSSSILSFSSFSSQQQQADPTPPTPNTNTTAPPAVSDPVSTLNEFIDPSGTCGNKGYVPIQHHWIDVETLSVPASCSPQCICLDEGYSAESKCRTCTKRCNHAADGGSLNSTSCTCECNLGFDGATCGLCAAYSLFTIQGISSDFMAKIHADSDRFSYFLSSLGTQLASILQVSNDAIRIDPKTTYARENAIKMVVLLRGSCDGFLSKPVIDLVEYARNSTLLYATRAEQTSIFAVFPRWEKLYAYWRDYASKAAALMVKDDGATLSLNEDDGANSLSNEEASDPEEELSALLLHQQQQQQQQQKQQQQRLLSRQRQAYSSRRAKQQSSSSSTTSFQTLQSSTTPTTTTSDSAVMSDYDTYNNFFNGGVLSSTGGSLSLTSLYAPKCVGADCPTGDNPYDIAQCFTAIDCLPTPPTTDGVNQIDDAVLYIIIAVVITILLLLVIGIVVFCCCSSRSSSDDDIKDETTPVEPSQQSNPALSESSLNTESRVDSLNPALSDTASVGAMSTSEGDDFTSRKETVVQKNAERQRAMTLRLQQQSRYDSDCEIEMIHL